MYLFLKPGLIIPEGAYAHSTLPIQMADLSGWTSFLRAYRVAFMESSAYGQGQISLVAATFDYCLVTAEREARSEGTLAGWMSTVPLLDAKTASKAEETELAWMSWANKRSLLKAFKSPEQASDELTRWACSGLPRVTHRGAAVALDAFLGAGGAVITVKVLWRIGYQYNFIAAVVVAVVLPALHGLFRWRLKNRA
jgi:hypothetical protein